MCTARSVLLEKTAKMSEQVEAAVIEEEDKASQKRKKDPSSKGPDSSYSGVGCETKKARIANGSDCSEYVWPLFFSVFNSRLSSVVRDQHAMATKLQRQSSEDENLKPGRSLNNDMPTIQILEKIPPLAK